MRASPLAMLVAAALVSPAIAQNTSPAAPDTVPQSSPASAPPAVPAQPEVAGTQLRTADPAPVAAPATDQPARTTFDLTKWTPPGTDTLGQGAQADAIRLGERLMNETYALIGPEVQDQAKRYSGNNLACTNCHEEGGTKPYAMPLVGITGQFPQFRARSNAVATLEDRVNGCMQRSMNGKPLPLDSVEMTAFLAYFSYISRDVPIGAKLTGAGVKSLPLPTRAADPAAGKPIYAEVCATCHGPDGFGQRNGRVGDAAGYAFPPIAGPDSFNDGAGMFRLLTASRYIHANMPKGTDYTSPVLSEDEAYDVAAYLETLPRPHKSNPETDFPDRLKKPVDTPFPPFADNFPAEQHKFGPFGPIQDWHTEAQHRAAAQAEGDGLLHDQMN